MWTGICTWYADNKKITTSHTQRIYIEIETQAKRRFHLLVTLWVLYYIAHIPLAEYYHSKHRRLHRWSACVRSTVSEHINASGQTMRWTKKVCAKVCVLQNSSSQYSAESHALFNNASSIFLLKIVSWSYNRENNDLQNIQFTDDKNTGSLLLLLLLPLLLIHKATRVHTVAGFNYRMWTTLTLTPTDWQNQSQYTNESNIESSLNIKYITSSGRWDFSSERWSGNDITKLYLLLFKTTIDWDSN